MRPSCPDCGEYPVNHPVEWMGALMDSAVTAITVPFDAVVNPFESFLLRTLPIDRLALLSFKVMAFLRLGTLKEDADALDSARTKFLWASAKRRGMRMFQFRMMNEPTGTNLFVVFKGDRPRSFDGLPRPKRGNSKSLPWMDNKAILKKKLLEAGIPVPRGKACLTYAEALRVMDEVGAPVITKPHIGSRSRHATVRITNADQLRAGFLKAKRLSPWVVVEQELQGDLFRVLLVNGAVAGIIRREVAHVTGDGVRTVRQLFEDENKHPLRAGPTFHPLRDDEEAARELARQGMDWGTIAAKDQVVALSTHLSRYYGGSTSDFTDRAHPDNVALFERLARVLGDSLVGVDFIIGDMERPWRGQKLCGIIECNSLPNIDLHHDVFSGNNRDIAGLLLDLAFDDR